MEIIYFPTSHMLQAGSDHSVTTTKTLKRDDQTMSNDHNAVGVFLSRW